MAITTLSMVLTVFVLNLHHITDRPVPRWARTLVLVYLARLLCMCQYVPHSEADEYDKAKKDKYRVTPNSLSKAIGSQIGILANLNGGPNQPSGERGRRGGANRAERGAYVDQHGAQFRSHYTFQTEEVRRPKKDQKKLEEEWARDWRRLAEVVDRLFFWMFLSAIVITTLLLFHPLTKAYFSLLGDETILKGDMGEDEPTT